MASNKKLTVEIGAKVFGASDVANLGKSIKGLDAAVRPAASAIEELKAQAQKLASRSGATANELRSAITIYENLKDVVALNGKEHSDFSREITTISNKLNPFKQKVSSLRQEYNASTNSLKRYNDELQRNNSYAARYLRGNVRRLEIPKPQQQLMLPPGRTDKQRRELFGGLRFDQMMQGMSLDSSGQARFDLRPGFDRITPGMRSYGFTGDRDPRRSPFVNQYGQYPGPNPVSPISPRPDKFVPDDALLDLTNYEGGLRKTRQEIQNYQAEQRKFIESNRRAGISTKDIIGQLNQFASTSNKSTSALQFQRDQLNQLRNTLAPIDDQYDKITKSIERLDKQLEKRAIGSKARRGQQMSSILGTTLAAGVFGGPEGFLGGAIGGGLELAGLLGPGGAITGAAIGATVNQFRKFVGSLASTYAEVARLNIGLRQLNTVQGDVSATSANIQQALGAVQERAAAANQPIAQTTKSLLRLQAAVKGAGGSTALAVQSYKSITQAITATGGSTEDAKAAVIALSQVYSKGKLSAEELTQQLAERLSGAVTLFAEATGRTLPKLQDDLKNGLVGLQDVVEFQVSLQEKFSYTAFEMASSSEAAGDRMAVAFEQAGLSIGKALQPIGAEFQDFFTEITIGAVQAANTLGLLSRRPFESDKGIVDVTARRRYDLGNAARRTRKGLIRLGQKPEDSVNLLNPYGFNAEDLLGSREDRAVELVRDLESQLSDQKNAAGLEQNINTYKSMIRDLKQITQDAESVTKDSTKLIELINELQVKVDKLQPILQKRRRDNAALFAAGFKETEEEKLRLEAQEKAYARNRGDAEKLANLNNTLNRRSEAARRSAEEKIARIRQDAIKQVEQLEESIIANRQQAERQLEDRRIALQRLEEDATRSIGLTGEAKQLQDELIRVDREFEDQKRQLAREQQDRELSIKKEVIRIEQNAASAIQKAQQQTAREIGNMNIKYAQDVDRILTLGADKRVLLDTKLLSLQTATYERIAQAAKYQDATGNVIPLPRNGDYGSEELNNSTDPLVEKVKQLDRNILDLMKGFRNANDQLFETTDEALPRFNDSINTIATNVIPQIDNLLAGNRANDAERLRTESAIKDQGQSNAFTSAVERILKSGKNRITDVSDKFADNAFIRSLESKEYQKGTANELANIERFRQNQQAALSQVTGVYANEAGEDPAKLEAVYQTRVLIGQEINRQAEQHKQMILAEDERLRKTQELLDYQSQLKDLSNGIANSIGNGIGEAMSLVIEGTENWGESLREIAAGVLKDIANQLMQMMVIKPLVNAIGGGLSNLFGVPAVTGNAMGNAYAKNKIVPYAKGGVINSPMLFKFAKGGMLETGLAGEAGPEGILPLKRTRSGDLGVQSSGGGSTVINVKVDASGSSVQGDAPKSDMLGKAIAKAVNQEIIKQKRAGGLLA